METGKRRRLVMPLNLVLLLLFLLPVDAKKDTSHQKLFSCQDTHEKCKDKAYKRQCSSIKVRKECPRTCHVCEPTAEDLVFENILAAKNENQKMMIATVAVLFFFSVGVFKVMNAPTICHSKGNLKGKTVILTGGTSGIGYETAFHLAKRGAKVIIGCRKLKTGLRAAKKLREQSGHKLIEVKILDLTSLASVRDFASEVSEECPTIDILINNAATIATKQRQVTPDNFEETFQVNYLAPFLLTTLLINKMKKQNKERNEEEIKKDNLSGGSRIINLVCDFQHGKLNFVDLQSKHNYSNMAAYYNSKLALLYFTNELSKVLEKTNISSYAVNPGVCETNLWRNVFPYNWRITWLFLAPWVYLFCRTPNYGAETTYYCALDRDVGTESGKYYKNCKEVGIGKFNEGKSKKLWEVSERLTQHYLSHVSFSSNERTPRKPRVTFDTNEPTTDESQSP